MKRKNRIALVVVGFALMVCALGSGCPSRDAGDEGSWTIIASGDTAGWIVPCGCASNQSGGLLRRASCVKQFAERGDVLLVDVGGAPGGTSPYDRVKLEAIAKGEIAMGIAAHNIGAGEAALGPEALRRLAEKTGVPLVSANARDRQGAAIAEPLRIIEVGRRRVAVVGVLGEEFATGEIDVTPPHQAVLDALAAVAEQYDVIVVLAYLPEDELRRFAEMLPEADVVIGGPTAQPIQPTRIGPTQLASATKQGKFLAVFSNGTPGADSIVELNEKFADDPRQLTNLGKFYDVLAERDFMPGDTSFVEPLPKSIPKGFAVAGSERCQKCHKEEFRIWEQSGHQHAWKPLVKKGAHVDPDCQRCHTTGYGLPGGFTSAKTSPSRVGVGCESCHGPSQAHVDDPKTRTPHFACAANHCVACHDHENSPEFTFDEYWKRITHEDSSGE